MTSNSAAGVAILLFSLVALGTWPALLDLSSALHGRHPSHSYLDYCTTVLLVAAVLAVVSGEPLANAGWPSIFLAGGGGVLLMLGNLSMQRALLMGVPLTIVLPLQGSLTVSLGTGINFGLQPDRSEPHILGAGVLAFLVAILLSALAHVAHERSPSQASRTRQCRQPMARGVRCCCCCCLSEEAPLMTEIGVTSSSAEIESSASAPEAAAEVATASSSAHFPTLPPLGAQPDARSAGAIQNTARDLPRREGDAVAGLCVAAGGGLCFGFFSPAFNLAVNDELGWIRGAGGEPLGVFAANLYFCLCFAASGWAANLGLMRCPPPGAARSSLSAYVRSSRHGRGLAVLAGSVCALGNGAQFLGGSMAGFAAADLVQAFPLIGTLWGIGCLGEFRRASRRVYALLAAMYVTFIAAVSLLALSVR